MSRTTRRLGMATAALAGSLVVGCISAPGPHAEQAGTDNSDVPRRTLKAPQAGKAAFRAFAADSWWNTPVPANAPKSPQATEILNYMRTAKDAGDGCLRLAGTGDNKWGQPVFWAKTGDPEFNVRTPGVDKRSAHLSKLRIPSRARAAATSDAAMTVFDKERGIVTAFTGARFDESAGQWTARGATVTRLSSNGLHWKTGRPGTAANRGTHRGNNGATMMVRFGEVRSGAIRHVLKVASGPETSSRYVFPMVGSDGDSNDPVAPAQGLRFRIKPSVDIDRLKLGPQATVIAKALQTYGMYLGDNAGTTTLKLQDTRASGYGQLWQLKNTSLCKLPFTPQYWDVIRGGYDPSR